MVAYIVLVGWISVTKNPIPRWMLIFLHAYIFATIVTLTRSIVVKVVAYIIIYVLFLTELMLEWCYGMSISPTVLSLLVETNGRESSEFIETLFKKPQMWQALMLIVCVLIVNIVAERYRLRVVSILKSQISSLRSTLPLSACNASLCEEPSLRRLRRFALIRTFLKVIACILLTGGVVFSYSYVKLLQCKEMNEVDEWRSHMRNPDDLMTKLLVSVYDLSIAEKEMERVIMLAEAVPYSTTLQTEGEPDSLNVVFVIGESYIREHAALYGYPLMTTPFLSKEHQEGRLFVFKDMVSPYNQTTRVIRNLLSCNSLGHGEGWASAPPFTALFKKNGYHVAIYDNQKNFDTGLVFAFSLNTYLYHPRIVETCYSETNDSTFEYDGQLIDHYMQTTNDQQSTPNNPLGHRTLATSGTQERRPPKRLVIFHLLGQHMGFEHRYPENFARFNVDSTRFRKEPWLTEHMRQDIAHYDNATLYNDHVMEKIIGLYTQQNTVVVYLSDHGEEVFDYRDNLGRDDWNMGSDPKQVLRWQYMTPFMVWCSDKYANGHPNIIEQLKQATGRPAMLDNVCQMLFHLAGLQTPYYHSDRDVLSPNYRCPKRLINDMLDCDSIMK